MSDLEKIDAIIKEGFGIKLNNLETQKLLSSEYLLTIMFNEEGKMQFAIVEGADPKSNGHDWWKCISELRKMSSSNTNKEEVK